MNDNKWTLFLIFINLATIVMPNDAPEVKRVGTLKNGAQIISYDRTKEDREAICLKLVEEKNMKLIPPFDYFDVIAGQGTAAKELFEEVGELDYLFVCCGGAGLLSGSSIAAKELSPNCKVYGVEPQAGNDAQKSFRTGAIVKIATPITIADGAQTQAIGKLPFEIIKNCGNIADIVTVTDDELITCLKFFANSLKLVVEPTGCLGLAGVLFGGIDLSSSRVGVIVSGGNVDMCKYIEFLSSSN